MDFTNLVNIVSELVVFKNNIITNSKKIFQLPDYTIGNLFVAVWNDVELETQKFNLSDALGGVWALTNKILQLGEITRVGDTFTFSVGYQWRINGIIYSNAETDLTINPAASGYHRIDIAVLGTNNNIYIVQGVEVLIAETAQEPPAPIDTLELCSFIIEEAAISEPAPPVGAQNNIPLKKEILSTDLADNTIADFVDYFNSMSPPMLVKETTSLIQFILTDTNEILQITGKGKGLYGLANLQITASNVIRTKVRVFREDFNWTSGPQTFDLPEGIDPKNVFHNRSMLFESEFEVTGDEIKTVNVNYITFEPSETNIITITN